MKLAANNFKNHLPNEVALWQGREIKDNNLEHTQKKEMVANITVPNSLA